MTLADELSVALAAAGLAPPVLATLASRTPRAGVAMTMELWTASGLLHLSGAPSWRAVAFAAAVVLARQLVLARINQAQHAPQHAKS